MLSIDQSAVVRIRLKAYKCVTVVNTGRDRGDAEFPCSLPVTINMGSVALFVNGQEGDIGVKTDGFSDFCQLARQGNVAAIDVIGAIYSRVESFADALLLCPLTKLLSATTVVGVGAVAKGQVELFGNINATLHHGLNIVSTREEIFERLTFLRRFRVERENAPADVEVEFFPESIGTHGTEIAPRSDVIEKKFKCFHTSKSSRQR